MNPVVVSVAVGRNFPKMVTRLQKGVKKFGNADFLAWVDEYPPGSPTHQQVPYGFKVYAIREAWKRGYDCVLWTDSRLFPIRPYQQVFDYIEEHGYFFMPNGFSVAQWCVEPALRSLGITREEAEGMSDIVGGFFGLDKRNPQAVEFLARMIARSKDGVSFHGPRSSHRHDQTVMSVVRIKMGLGWRDSPESWLSFPGPGAKEKEHVIFMAGGKG